MRFHYDFPDPSIDPISETIELAAAVVAMAMALPIEFAPAMTI